MVENTAHVIRNETTEAGGGVAELETAMGENGIAIDADGSDAGPNMQLLAKVGANRLNVPAEVGGPWQGGQWAPSPS